MTAGIPCPQTPVFLSRSGSTAPLDITLELIELCELNAPDLNAYTQRAREAIDLIVAHGGIFSRWQRLWVQTDAYYTFLAVMDLLQFSSMPSLQYLEIISVERAVYVDEGYTYPSYGADPQVMPWFSGSSLPLRTVKLERIPKRYLFGPVTYFRPIGLTRLELQFVESYPDIADIHAMLTATCSTLVTLCLDEDSPMGFPNPQNLNGKFSDILFPDLQAVSLWPTKALGWSVGLLKMFRAPNLSVLRINVPYIDGDDPDCMQVVELLTCSSKGIDPKPYFPALTHLCYSARGTITFGQEQQLRMILSAYPNIVSLSLPLYFRPGAALTTEPWLAPGLVRLKLKVTSVVDELKGVIESRNSGGIPLKTVEIESCINPLELRWLQKHVETVIVYNRYKPRLADPWSW